MFFVHTTLQKFRKATITGHFGFMFEENQTRLSKLHDYRDAIDVEKLCFRNGLVWTVGLTVEIKPRSLDAASKDIIRPVRFNSITVQ